MCNISESMMKTYNATHTHTEILSTGKTSQGIVHTRTLQLEGPANS